MSIAARRSHRGDEYQLAVAVHWLIRLLSDPDIVSVQVDAISLPGSTDTVDVDDIVVTYNDGKTRHIQAKKNQPSDVARLSRPARAGAFGETNDTLHLLRAHPGNLLRAKGRMVSLEWTGATSSIDSMSCPKRHGI